MRMFRLIFIVLLLIHLSGPENAPAILNWALVAGILSLWEGPVSE